MVDERGLILLLAVAVVAVGTGTAVTRPGLWRLGQDAYAKREADAEAKAA